MPINILSWEEARDEIEICKEKGQQIISTNGCFDLVHRGHVEYLEKAKSLGDYLIVGINSDESVRKLKGPKRPLNNELDRAIVLGALESVDAVCVFSEQTPVRWLEFIKPHTHCKGGDYEAEKIPEYETMKQWNGKIEILSFVEGYSTTKTISKMEE